MKCAFAVLLLLCSAVARAQESPLAFPVSIFDGHVLNPYDVRANDERGIIKKRAIKTVKVKYPPEDKSRADTPVAYREVYTAQGDKLPFDQERGNFEGQNRIEYNAKGRMTAKQWMYDRIEGCGTGGHYRVVVKHRTTYEYEDGRLVLEATASGNSYVPPYDTTLKASGVVGHRYNKSGLEMMMYQYSILNLPKPDTSSYEDGYYYVYDKKKRLLLQFIVETRQLINDNGSAKQRLDSLTALAPANFGDMLLRQSIEWHDTVQNRMYAGITDTSEEAEEAMTDAISLRDSLDDMQSDFYDSRTLGTNDFKGCIAYSYNSRGLLTGYLHFKRESLTRKDTFIYNHDNQLVKWDSWHLDYDGDFQDWESDRLNPLPTHRIWEFEYTRDGRVASSNHSKYETRYPDEHLFIIDYRLKHLFTYNPDGTVRQVAIERQKHNYNLNPDVFPPVSYFNSAFIIDYERF